MAEKIYLYLSANKSVSFDAEHWYINDIPQEGKEGESINDLKISAQSESFKIAAQDICKYLSHFSNIAVLTAAGTSMENGKHPGKTRKELWDSYLPEITKIADLLTTNDGFLKNKCNEIIQSQNIENFLSLAILYEKLNGSLIDEDGKQLKVILEKKIADACRLELDDENLHHQDFIRKLTARKPSDSRVQLYTTNYDTLFEQAAVRLNYTIIDGFSFSYPRVFNGANFDKDIVYRNRTRINQEDSFVPGVIQLFKLHGSIDWEKQCSGSIMQKENVDQPCIIYPATEKYESSYEQPYFEMMSHFQQTLRQESTLLMVAGFGFQDKHIQNAIHEAVCQNPNFHLFIVCFGNSPHIQEDGKEKWDNYGITRHLVPEYLNKEGHPITNVSILYATFKQFVEIFPLNPSYSNQNANDNDAI